MISVVVPVFNMKQFLPRLMHKLINQAGNYEIILVNDGSTDGSANLCEQYAQKYSDRIRVVHKENGGLSSARNTGIHLAKGEYVIFPDPDDWVELNFISRLQELQEQYLPDLLCIGHYIDFDQYSIPANKGESMKQMDCIQAQRALLIPPCINGFAWNKLYRLELIRKYELSFLDDVGTTEDLDFAFRYLQYCKRVIFVPEERLYHYYQRSGAATHSGFSQKKLQAIRTYEKIIKISSDIEMVHAAKEEICNSAVNLSWAYQEANISDEETWEKLRKYLRQYLRYYLGSRRYGIGRKLQAFLAFSMPKRYAWLKNRYGGNI